MFAYPVTILKCDISIATTYLGHIYICGFLPFILSFELYLLVSIRHVRQLFTQDVACLIAHLDQCLPEI